MLVVFTDLDGTLLDHETYEWQDAEEALDRCRRLQVPVVLVSSKTRAEMEALRIELGLFWPLVSENGGGIFFPEACPMAPPTEANPCEGGHVMPLGLPYERLVRTLRSLREETGWGLRGFSDMGLEEICRRTGLPPEKARLASRREYDEPFVWEDGNRIDVPELVQEAEKRGARVTRGGRFFHLFGSCDKGEAVLRLATWFQKEYPVLWTAGLGDSLNDVPMLRHVDRPILVRSAQSFGDRIEAVPGLRVTEERGPAGWNRAVLNLLEEYSNGGMS
jgi:mannosyl-3-phosphoglycerate phosphatase